MKVHESVPESTMNSIRLGVLQDEGDENGAISRAMNAFVKQLISHLHCSHFTSPSTTPCSIGRRKQKLSGSVVVTVKRPRPPAPAGNQVVTVCCNPSEKIKRTTTFVPPDAPSLPENTTIITPEGEREGGLCDSLPSQIGSSIDDDFVDDNLTSSLDDGMEGNTYGATGLAEWADLHRQHYLEELMRHDGRAGSQSCVDCTAEEGLYKCQDCFGYQLYCKMCYVKRHSLMPFHRTLFWTGTYFQDITLKSLGLTIHLGHGGSPCSSPGERIEDFTIVDTNGVHVVDLQFCGCYLTPASSRQRTQLLRAGLLPPTHVRPTSAFTFNVLHSFHLLTLQGKTNAYDYYLSLEHLSDNTGSGGVKNRYEQFLVAMRIWRHLKLIKCAGRAYDPSGVASTQAGECAVECPACLQPGRNLPVEWDRSPSAKQLLYRLILTVDANFRLKCKDKNTKNNASLGDGWGHWVPETGYKAYLAEYGHQAEPNLCNSQLRAVDHANLKVSTGYSATGVGGVVCARHCLVRKGGLGDLQKGERYANMDYLVFSSIAGSSSIRSLVLSYDIACQWSRHVSKRVAQLPPSIQPSTDLLNNTMYAIPKAHINGHGEHCQISLSFNLLKHSARTDGEEPERWWAHINPISMSTREMSLGSQHETIDDHAAAWNWRKITDLDVAGPYLLGHLQDTLRMRSKTRASLARFSARFSFDLISEWEGLIDAWDEDRSRPNPYANPQNRTTIADVQRELAEEDLHSFVSSSVPEHQMSSSTFLQMGFDIEEQQRLLHLFVNSNAQQHAKLQEKRSQLMRRILRWRETQLFYMPQISELVASDGELPKPESIVLYMPSTVPTNLTISAPLIDKERRLRQGQAEDALTEVKRLLRVRFGLQEYKYTQIGYSQKANTRMRTRLARFQDKISCCAERYQAAWTALLRLDPDGSWTDYLLELKAEHIKGPGREMDDHNDESIAGEEDFDKAVLQVEWARTAARAARWEEEVVLLVEEMRRVLWYFQWKRTLWLERPLQCKDLRPDLKEGFDGYAAKQVAVLDGLGIRFSSCWYLDLVTNGLQIDWPAEYLEKWKGTQMDVASAAEIRGGKGDKELENDDDDDEDMEDDMY